MIQSNQFSVSTTTHKITTYANAIIMWTMNWYRKNKLNKISARQCTNTVQCIASVNMLLFYNTYTHMRWSCTNAIYRRTHFLTYMLVKIDAHVEIKLVAIFQMSSSSHVMRCIWYEIHTLVHCALVNQWKCYQPTNNDRIPI